MKKLFLSPHDDDHALFGAFTCLREKPIVLVVTDSWIQPNRGEKNCDAATRARETAASCRILGCDMERLYIRDDQITEGILESKLQAYRDYNVIFAPALQGGNPHHDMVSRTAHRVFHDKKVYHYTTYTKTDLWTTGSIEIVPTPEELEIKQRALACYESQINLPSTRPHFEAVQDKSEWFV